MEMVWLCLGLAAVSEWLGMEINGTPKHDHPTSTIKNAPNL
jgi:hypothetical protein